MTTSQKIPIWLNPQRFWAATRNMNPAQADSLMKKVSDLAERRETEALREFDFIIVGNLGKSGTPSN
jgi:hypothetical protein